ncbi:8-oxo-dGTP diphosphatase MutT [Pseudoalteromonas sp. NEC-BIFX-2020_002]|uniref:8-oxo-dGTP diphosphatase n=1 Tax=Pseudoalteromonas porphyrae TaxID=187330 RepID=A0A0N0M1X8_9GAMM|nr:MULTISPECIES: 8-oxo-dGTP diphosphatase MutT [Pseudoalteromonas]KPH65129.1 7,8-dihydro-8-oxoguanine-triphosphatase [Pseudoalteromonas porphyrae]NMR27034.1 8-oxo-dGTP diphosphatase MutT [Pseudoalteromonas sp. NEC-BIFX-2020_015]NNG45165.1 8-oxo-dGTP diphosphatase MutT [Pseudoalteromonas sp. NEC-BIFX-2020_002]
MTKKIIHVAVGVIKAGNTLFICKRPDDKHQGGLWEFPGGKVESGETVFEALKRELIEEVALTIHSSSQLMVIEHDYGDKCVKLDVHVVTDFSGDAHGAEGQLSAWVAIDKLSEYNFPAANVEIIEKIKTQF